MHFRKHGPKVLSNFWYACAPKNLTATEPSVRLKCHARIKTREPIAIQGISVECKRKHEIYSVSKSERTDNNQNLIRRQEHVHKQEATRYVHIPPKPYSNPVFVLCRSGDKLPARTPYIPYLRAVQGHPDKRVIRHTAFRTVGSEGVRVFQIFFGYLGLYRPVIVWNSQKHCEKPTKTETILLFTLYMARIFIQRTAI